ncbi:MAG: sulfide/dihydroorotate dehydrogenase-like FAD/NAD-binding protein [Candidatus Aminicenantes bacterium]|nr:sulfide/dihydroorotate dehydrogenase-like FAD/NAD-binding protein [Candidatus Aminicenantes bacterium]
MMPKILVRQRLVPNLHLIEVEAPEVAKKCRPGQFVILMPDERGERIPLSIADWDPDRGSVTAVFLVVGTSTRKLAGLNPGDEIPVFVGPLGRPSEIDRFGTVVLAAGCFGIGALWPAARALKQAGNKVIAVLDAKADYLFYWRDRYRSVCDKVILSSRDHVQGSKDFIPKPLEDVLKTEAPVDRVIAVGCTYLMYACALATKPRGIKTIVSLNPIMVDGTGMCGGCRVRVGDESKFACVDGPEFDAHQVDWDELFMRRKSYLDDEIRSLCHWEETELP